MDSDANSHYIKVQVSLVASQPFTPSPNCTGPHGVSLVETIGMTVPAMVRQKFPEAGLNFA